MSIRTVTQEDPIGLAGGLNLYGFAGGDPINFSDPFGLCKQGTPGCLPMTFSTPNSLTAGRSQGEWTYTQGVKGTPARDVANKAGDCADFQNAAVRGAGWNIPRMSTSELAGTKGATYYSGVAASDVQPGDTWVSSSSGGHTGIVESIDMEAGVVSVLQNGGTPGNYMTNGSESMVLGYSDRPTRVGKFAVSGSVFLRPKGRKAIP